MGLRPGRREKEGGTVKLRWVRALRKGLVCEEKQRLSNNNGSCSVAMLLFILILSWLCNVETVSGTGP